MYMIMQTPRNEQLIREALRLDPFLKLKYEAHGNHQQRAVQIC